MHMVQFKIADFIMLLELLQQLGQVGRDIFCLAIAIISVCPSQILLDNVQTLEISFFKDLELLVTRNN